MSEKRAIGGLKSSASSVVRVMKDRAEVATVLGQSETKARLKQVAKPNSVSKTLRNAGVALILAPDPITAVPGAIMLGASFATKGKSPLTPASVFTEAEKMLDEMGSFI